MSITEEVIDRIFNKEINIRNLIDKYNILFAIIDDRHHFLKLNIHWEDVLGYTIDELTKKPFTEFVHPDDLDKTVDAYKKDSALNEDKMKNFTNRYRTKDGKYAVIDWFNIIKTNSEEIISIAIFKHYD